MYINNLLSIFNLFQTGPEYGQGMNPISRLAQIQQAKKEKEPEYILLSERGMPRRREFVMQVLFVFMLEDNDLILLWASTRKQGWNIKLIHMTLVRSLPYMQFYSKSTIFSPFHFLKKII